MNFLACQSDSEVARITLEELRKAVRSSKRPLRTFFPTGRTPRPLYGLLKAERQQWAGAFVPLQIDEFAQPERLFFNELKDQLLAPLDLVEKTLALDPAWSDNRMKVHVASVIESGIDMAILGMGPNGHVGFHEPGLAADFEGGRVVISNDTRNRVPGAATNDVLTFGTGTFLKAKRIYLLITGERKEDAFARFMSSSGNEDLPAAYLKSHADLTVLSTLY